MLGRDHSSSKILRVALVASMLVVGCAALQPGGPDERAVLLPKPSAPSGAALGLRKLEMQRALYDSSVFHETLAGMIARRDRTGVDAFSPFVTLYLKSHLGPMLQGGWQSGHAEFIDLDANLRVLEADLLAQMGRSQEMQRSLDALRVRYAGRESLLVDFPVGEETPLGEAIELIRLRLDSCLHSRPGRGPAGRAETPGAISQAVCLGSS